LTSTVTILITIRVRKETFAKIEQRCDKYPGEMYPRRYIQDIVEFMVNRKHIKARKPQKEKEVSYGV